MSLRNVEIFHLCSINPLFVKKTERVYCVVRTESIHIIQVKFCLLGRAISQAFTRCSLTAEARVPSQATPYEICGRQSGMVFIRQYHSTSAPNLYSTTCCSYQKNKQLKTCEPFKKQFSFGYQTALGRNVLSLFYRQKIKYRQSAAPK